MRRGRVLAAVLALACAACAETAVPVTAEVNAGRAPVRIPRGAGDFAVERPRPSDGPVVKAADFGFSATNACNGAAVARALAHCRAVRASRLELAPGTYDCFDADRGLVVAGLVDFTLDGKGARLVFRRPARHHLSNSDRVPDDANLLVSNCVRTAVCNLSMDWDWAADPLCDVGRVVGKHVDERPDESYFDLELEPVPTQSEDWEAVKGRPFRHPWFGRPMPIQTMTPLNAERTRLTAEQPERLLFGLCEGHFGTKMAWLAPDRVRIWPNVKPEGQYLSPTYDWCYGADQNLRHVKTVPVGLRYRVFHYYYGKNGINVHSNRHLTLEDIDIASCFGMGMVTDGAQEYTQFVRVNVEPVRGRPCSATSDGCHIARSKGHTKFLSCRMAFQNDDGFNFHDCFTLGVPEGRDRIRIVNARGYPYFGAAVGNEIELAQADFASTGWSCRLKAVEGDDLVFDRPVPELKGDHFLVFDNTYRSDYVLMKDCVYTDTHLRGLLQPNHMTFENCTFRRTGSGMVIVSAHSRDVWCEGRGSRDIVFRGCTFEHTNARADPDRKGDWPEFCTEVRFAKPLPATGGFSSELPEGFDRGFFSDLLVEKCRFVDSAGLLMSVRLGRNFVFRDNDVVFTGGRAERPLTGGFRFRNAEGMFVTGNRFRFAPGMKAQPSILADTVSAASLVVHGNTLRR